MIISIKYIAKKYGYQRFKRNSNNYKKNNLKIDPILINNVDLEQFSDELSSGKSSNKLSPLDLIDNNNLPPINKYCNVDSDDDSDDYIYSYKKNILDSPPQSPMPSYTPFSYPLHHHLNHHLLFQFHLPLLFFHK